MFSKILDFIKKHKFTLLLSIYMLVIVYFQVGLKLSNMFSVLNILMVLVLLNFLAKFKYTQILVCILAIWISVDAFYAFQYSSYLTLGIMASIFETNRTEMQSVLGDLLLPSVIILILTIILVLFSKKELHKSQLSKKLSAILLSVYILVCFPVMSIGRMVWFGDQTFEEFISEDPLLSLQLVVSNKASIFYGDILSMAAYSKEMSRLKDYFYSERDLPAGVDLQQGAEIPEKIYLVLGESSSRNYYSLYDYKIKTTPFLDSLFVNGNALRYYDAISPAASTRQSIPLILSFGTSSTNNKDLFYTKKNLIELANLAGYETCWVSNQDQMGLFEGYISAIAMASGKEIYEVNNNKDDLYLAHYLQKEHKPGTKQFFVIHLEGSHISYLDKSDEVDRQAIQGDRELDQYNRTIHHTDRVLRELTKIMRTDSSSVLYYLSDHGEVVDKRGHGFLNEGLSQFEVPLITITNGYSLTDTIVSKYVEKESNIINVSNTVYILAEMMGYKINNANTIQAVKDGRYVMHVDSKAYLHEDVIEENR